MIIGVSFASQYTKVDVLHYVSFARHTMWAHVLHCVKSATLDIPKVNVLNGGATFAMLVICPVHVLSIGVIFANLIILLELALSSGAINVNHFIERELALRMVDPFGVIPVILGIKVIVHQFAQRVILFIFQANALSAGVMYVILRMCLAIVIDGVTIVVVAMKDHVKNKNILVRIITYNYGVVVYRLIGCPVLPRKY